MWKQFGIIVLYRLHYTKDIVNNIIQIKTLEPMAKI